MDEIAYFLDLDGIMVYVVMAAALLGGAVGLPIPEDLPLIVAGKLIKEGRAQPIIMFIICYLAIIAGDTIIFLFGYWSGKKLFKSKYFRRRFSEEQVQSIKNRLERHSLLMIFVARHLFYLRSLTFLTCGAFRMRIGRFIAADALAALVSAPLMMSIGYFTADYINAALELLGDVKQISVLVGLAVILVAVLAWRLSKRSDAHSS